MSRTNLPSRTFLLSGALLALTLGLLSGYAAPGYRWQAGAKPYAGHYRLEADAYQPQQDQAAGLVKVQVNEWFEREPLPHAGFKLTDTRSWVTWQGMASSTGNIPQPLPPASTPCTSAASATARLRPVPSRCGPGTRYS